MINKLVIINNESVYNDNNSFFCDNVALKSIFEGLNKNFEVLPIVRKSKTKRFNKINLKKVITASNIFVFLSSIFNTFNKKNTTYLIISITPYTFLAYFILFISRKKIFLYLRSNGYEEYKSIIGFFGPIFYHLMYVIVTHGSKVITCQKRLIKKKGDLVFPSEISSNWTTNFKKPLLDKPRILYVGRLKVEKGIFSFLKIFNEIFLDIEFSIVGKFENLKLSNKKINFVNYINNTDELIEIYDKHNIFILPSFTEAHPQVVDESLARLRPVIIFKEISHVIQNREGVFVSERNAKSVSEKIKYIMENYLSIQLKMQKNKLPTKNLFISQMTEILKAH